LEAGTSLLDECHDAGPVCIRTEDVAPPLLGDVNGDLRDLRVEHLLQAHRLGNDLSQCGEDVARATSALVLHGKKPTGLVFLDGIGDSVQPQLLADQRNPMMDHGSSPVVSPAGVDPFVPGFALYREVVVSPDAVR